MPKETLVQLLASWLGENIRHELWQGTYGFVDVGEVVVKPELGQIVLELKGESFNTVMRITVDEIGVPSCRKS